MTFTTPDHKDSVVEHVRRKHVRILQNRPIFKSRVTRNAGSNDSAANNDTYGSRHASSKRGTGLAIANSKPAYDLHNRGRIHSHVAPNLPNLGTLVVQCNNSHLPHDQILSILNSLDPGDDPKRPNHFFNTLDLVASNLLERL